MGKSDVKKKVLIRKRMALTGRDGVEVQITNGKCDVQKKVREREGDRVLA